MEPCLFAATAGSVVIRYTLNIPAPEERLTRPTTGLVLGEFVLSCKNHVRILVHHCESSLCNAIKLQISLIC